jgi:dUTP pyrophosphatase
MIRVPLCVFPGGEGLPLPAYQTSGSAGCDLRASVTEPVAIEPGDVALIPTGIGLALPEGFEGQVRPRSGLALRHAITVINAPGTIDADYRGEISVPLINLGNKSFVVRRGERIAQLIVAPVLQVAWQVVGDLGTTERGGAGFGSTGV